MQSESSVWTDLSGRVTRTARVCVLAVVLPFSGGCGCSGTPVPSRPAGKPYAGVALRIACPEAVVAKLIGQQAAGWAGRTGASVTVGPEVAPADVVIVRPADLGAWAARDDAKVVPKAFMAEDQPARWLRILSAYRERLASWGGEPRAVPLAGEGYALVYRADLFADAKHKEGFRKAIGRQLEPPATWEAVAEAAEYFAGAVGKPSLPPLPADPDRLLLEFHFTAACYDRPALSESAVHNRVGTTLDPNTGMRALAFHFDPATGRPRLTTPAFVAAADWQRRVSKFRAPGPAGDPAAALADGSAVVAVLTLAELGRLPKDGDTVAARFGIAPLPGTRAYFGPAGAALPPPDRATGVNFVPYYGSGGWVAVVRAKCEADAAAFDLLGDLAGPARSLDRLSDPAAGLGPFRSEQLEQQREAVWQRYGLDAARTQRLVEGLRQFNSLSVANPVFAYRGPDQGSLMAALADRVRAVAAGQATAAEAMKAAEEDWQKLGGKEPQAKLAEWRRKSAGLE